MSVLLGPDRPATPPPPDLFRLFADTALTEDAVLSFATRHGLLGVAEDIEIRRDLLLRLGLPGDRAVICRGERLGRWQEEIADMRQVLWAWDYLQGRTEGIEHELLWVDSRESFDELALAARGKYLKGHQARTRRAREQNARKWIEDTTSKRLRGSTAPRIVTKPGQEPFFEYAPSAESLLGHLWEQVVRCLCGGTDYPRCARCQARFKQTRRDKKFCSDSCRALSSKATRTASTSRRPGDLSPR